VSSSSSPESSERARSLERMLATKPDDTRLQFGLALEYLKTDRLEEGVEMLERYLSKADDQGNAWGRLASALRRLGREEEAREALRKGILAAERHGHPSMAAELAESLGE
jgi:predicted Zn-dependent protease